MVRKLHPTLTYTNLVDPTPVLENFYYGKSPPSHFFRICSSQQAAFNFHLTLERILPSDHKECSNTKVERANLSKLRSWSLRWKPKKMVKCLNWVNRPVSLVVIHTNRQIATCFANFGGKFPSVTWSYHHPMKVGEGFRSKSSIAEQHWKPTAKWKQERPTCGCARGWLTARRWWGKNLDVPKRVREIFSKWIKNPNILTITSRWNNPFTKHWS